MATGACSGQYASTYPLSLEPSTHSWGVLQATRDPRIGSNRPRRLLPRFVGRHFW
jgi:hypothetical protein